MKKINTSDQNKLLLDLNDSAKFMSKQFDDFQVQLTDLVNSIKEIKEENKYLK